MPQNSTHPMSATSVFSFSRGDFHLQLTGPLAEAAFEAVMQADPHSRLDLLVDCLDQLARRPAGPAAAAPPPAKNGCRKPKARPKRLVDTYMDDFVAQGGHDLREPQNWADFQEYSYNQELSVDYRQFESVYRVTAGETWDEFVAASTGWRQFFPDEPKEEPAPETDTVRSKPGRDLEQPPEPAPAPEAKTPNPAMDALDGSGEYDVNIEDMFGG